MAGRWPTARTAVLTTPCGITCGAAAVLWLAGRRGAALTLLTALTGGVVGVVLERLARGRFDLPWLLRHLVVPALLVAMAADRGGDGDGGGDA